MGVSYTPVLAIGKQFDDRHEALEFYQRFVKLSEEELAEIEDIGLDEFLYDKGGKVRCECLDLYRGDWHYIGIRLNPRDVCTFAMQVESAEMEWEDTFPGEEPEMLHVVRIS